MESGVGWHGCSASPGRGATREVGAAPSRTPLRFLRATRGAIPLPFVSSGPRAGPCNPLVARMKCNGIRGGMARMPCDRSEERRGGEEGGAGGGACGEDRQRGEGGARGRGE